MSGLSRVACALVLGLPGPPRSTSIPAVAPQAAGPTVLEGQRSFGPGTDPRAIERMFRSATGEDALLLAELFELQNDVDVLVRETVQRYEQRGYFAILSAEHTLVALHRRYDALEASPFVMPLGAEAAEALVGMFADARFRVRRHVLEAVDREQRELRGALTLFRAHSRGVSSLDPSEIDRLVRRADLAAAFLRAIRKDLRLLQDPAQEDPERNPEAMSKLRDALVAGDPSARPFYDQWNVRWRGLGRRMLLDLETTRLQPLVQEERSVRDEGLRVAQARLRAVQTLLPGTDQSKAAGPEILEMKKSERHRLAIHTGLEALRLDPFLPELNLAVAEAYDYLDGGTYSRIYFDRFLALRGIRSYDQETIRNRDLDASEERALWIVSRWRPEATLDGRPPGVR